MARGLNATVYLHDEDGVVRGFGPGDVVPGWVAARITNPDVWTDDPGDDAAVADEPADGGGHDGPPPRAGKGARVEAWHAYAASIGVDVPDDATRDEIIAAVDDASET